MAASVELTGRVELLDHIDTGEPTQARLEHAGCEVSEIAWVEETAKAAAEREPTVVAFTFYDRRDLAPVGTGMLFRVSHVHDSAMLGLGLGLGERRGQGLGTEATRLMLDWAFNVLGLESVSLETLASNTAAIRAYERAGFSRIGVRHSAVMTGGKRHDVVLMEAIKAERLLPPA